MSNSDSAKAPSSQAEDLALLLGGTTKQISFEIKKRENYISLKLLEAVNQSSAKEFEKGIDAHFAVAPFMPVVVICNQIEDLSKAWVKALLLLCKAVRGTGKEVRFILASVKLAKVIIAEGMDSVFKRSPTLREALVELGITRKGALDVNFINPVLMATMNAFKVQVGVTPKMLRPVPKVDRSQSLGDISGVIGVVTPSFGGSIILAFPLKTALAVFSKMLGETYEKASPEVESGTSELTNIIFGQAKIALNERGYGLKPAIPTVVTGTNHVLYSSTSGPIVVVPFESELGNFFIEICMSL